MHIAKDWEPADFVMFGTRGNLLNLGQKCCFIQEEVRWLFNVKEGEYICSQGQSCWRLIPGLSSRDAAPG